LFEFKILAEIIEIFFTFSLGLRFSGDDENNGFKNIRKNELKETKFFS